MRRRNYDYREDKNARILNDDNFINGKRAIYNDEKCERRYKSIKKLGKIISSLDADDFYRFFNPNNCYNYTIDGAIYKLYGQYIDDGWGSCKWFNMMELKKYYLDNQESIDEMLWDKYADVVGEGYTLTDAVDGDGMEEYYVADGDAYYVDADGEPCYDPYDNDYNPEPYGILHYFIYGSLEDLRWTMVDDRIWYNDNDYDDYIEYKSGIKYIRKKKLEKLNKLSAEIAD